MREISGTHHAPIKCTRTLSREKVLLNCAAVLRSSSSSASFPASVAVVDSRFGGCVGGVFGGCVGGVFGGCVGGVFGGWVGGVFGGCVGVLSLLWSA
jgi:predicted lipid-binding transport protein (Tim44 family)